MSSAIGFVYLSQGPTGPAGNEGPRGPIGPTGVTTDQIGSRGANAPNIQDISFVEGKATVVLSNGTTFQATGFFGGATATDTATVHVVDYLNSASDSQTYSFLSSGNNTGSFIIRGITGGGSIVVSEDNEAIYIDSIYGISAGNTDSAGLVDNTLVYLKTNNQISSTTIGVTSGGFFHGTLDFRRPGATLNLSKILPRAKVKYIPPTYKTDDALPVTLNVGDAGLFYIRTPNGISGFSGDFKNSEIVSFTLIVESDDIWNFPDNVFFTNGENYLTCGKSIVNLTTFDQGTSWYAVVAARGLDINPATCSTRSLVGSCCFDGITGTSCRDFITKNECDVLSGSFHPLESCQTTCGSTFGICCSNGQCIQNSSYAECTAFGGTYLFGVTCGSFGASLDPTATNEFRLCFDGCQNQKVACCKDGKCLGDQFTKKQCENIIGGVAFVGKACSEVDCCIQNVKVGACCAGDGTCSQKTLIACKAANGTFLGEGELCGTVNCNCYANDVINVGRCCTCSLSGNTNCVYTTQGQCTNGVWTRVEGAIAGNQCSPADLSVCGAELLNTGFICQAPTFRCCKCLTNGTIRCSMTTPSECDGILKTTGICITNEFDETIGGCDCADVSSNCAQCQHQVIPGVKCSCQTVNGVRTKTCANIMDITVDTDCLNPASGVVCHANKNCGDTTSPCTVDDVWVNCTTQQSCQSPSVPESVDCPGTENITESTCSTCFPDGIPTNAEITFLASSLSSAQEMFVDVNGTVSSSSCTSGRFNTMHGFLAKDYFIPIKDDFICANGKDVQFCINIINDIGSFNTDSFVNSFRMYILRTMYPRYFSTNFAAMKGYTFASDDSQAGQVVSFIDENSPSVKSTNNFGNQFQISYKREASVWGRLHGFRNLAANTVNGGKQIQLLNSLKYANNLSSFLTTDGFDFINFNNIPELTEDSTININTSMMIDELNCPLFGYNPRGRFLGHESVITNGQAPRDPTSVPLGIQYSPATGQGNTFYFQSVNIGGRFGLQQSTMTGNGVLSLIAQDKINSDRIDNQPYINTSGGTSRSKSGFISKSIRSNSVVGLKNRSFGYTDLGYGKFCTNSFKTHQDVGSDIGGVLSIGNYTMEASTSRFANVFLNMRLFSATTDGSNSLTADTIIPYGYGYAGHPLFIDYIADFNATSTSGGLGGSQTNDIIEFNASASYGGSSIADNTCTFIGAGSGAGSSDSNIKTTRSPIYKTRPTTIICDTGVIDFFGNKIEDYNQPTQTNPDSGNAPKTFAHKRQYIGAINNPFYASPDSTEQLEPAISIISKTDTGIKICVKLKNYKDYVLTNAQINKEIVVDNDYSKYLREPTAADNTVNNLGYGSDRGRGLRITRAKNTLRLVIFNNPYNPYSAGISFGDNADFSDLRTASDKYINHLMTSFGNGFTFQFGCTGSSCNCKVTNTDSANIGKCNSCTITEEDKITNGYGVANAEDFICAISGGPKIHADPCGSCIRTIRRGYPLGYGTSLGSILPCSCRTQSSPSSLGINSSMSLSASFNCRNCTHTNTSPCSCKTTTLRENYRTDDIPGCSVPGIDTCPDCIDCTNPIDRPPGFGQLNRCISSCGGSNEKMGCATEEPIGSTLGGKNKLTVTKFFDQFGYVEGTDYWINSVASQPMVVWKLFPIFINGKENYYFPMVSPSMYMVLPVGGSNPPSFLREAICAPIESTPQSALNNCGVNNATLLSGIGCFHHCEIPGESCKLHVINDLLSPPLETMTVEFLMNELEHSDRSATGKPLVNKLTLIGDPCPTGGHYPDNNASNFTSTYKKFFFTEDQFICVNVDCSSIDCTLLQDCVP